jgi:hypothetical protein
MREDFGDHLHQGEFRNQANLSALATRVITESHHFQFACPKIVLS